MIIRAPVAQLDRAPASEAVGYTFKSCQAHHLFPPQLRLKPWLRKFETRNPKFKTNQTKFLKTEICLKPDSMGNRHLFRTSMFGFRALFIFFQFRNIVSAVTITSPLSLSMSIPIGDPCETKHGNTEKLNMSAAVSRNRSFP